MPLGIHTAGITQQWFADNGIPILNWPPYSPDMNPIENVQGRMECILNREYCLPEDSDTLFVTLSEIWNEIMEDEEYNQNLVILQ